MTPDRLARLAAGIRRRVEEALPWYDVALASRLHARTEAIAQDAEVALEAARRAEDDVMRASFLRAQRRLREGR